MEEYPRFLLVRSILNICPTNYEYKNIIERWVLSMANIQKSGRTDPVFVHSTPDAEINKKLERELVEKGVLPARGAREYMEVLVRMVNHFLKDPAGSFGLSRNQECPLRERPLEEGCRAKEGCRRRGHIQIINGRIEFGEFSYEIPEERAQLLLEIARGNGVKDPEGALVAMVMRYASLGLGSQQWSIPRAVYEVLYNSYEARLEGFASPLNSQLLAIDWHNCRICSLFPDTDRPFNSLGNFFEVEIPSNVTVVVNPPFIEEILSAAAHRCASLVGRGIVSFFIMPYWADTEAFRVVREQGVALKKLVKGKYFYYDAEKRRMVRAKFNSLLALFAPHPLSLQPILDAFALS